MPPGSNSRFSPFCICLQETALRKSTHISPPEYRAFSSTPILGQGHYDGIDIFVRKDIRFILLQAHLQLQVFAVKVFYKSFYLHCAVFIYLPVFQMDGTSLITFLNALPSSLLSMGNFTGRHSLRDDDTVNPRGLLIVSFIKDPGL